MEEIQNEDLRNFIANQNRHIELANDLIEHASGNEDVIRVANEIIESCNKAITIAQKANQIFISHDNITGQNIHNIMHCPDCKEDFHFEDTDIIDDVWVICPDCGSKICILE